MTDGEPPLWRTYGDRELGMNDAVEELCISTRVVGCLDSLGVKTIGELFGYSERYLVRMPNFGRKSLRELNDELERRTGRRLGKFTPDRPPPTKRSVTVEDRRWALECALKTGQTDPVELMNAADEILGWLYDDEHFAQ